VSTKKTIAVVSLAVVGALGALACSSGGTTVSSKAPAVSSGSSGAAAAAAAGKPAGPKGFALGQTGTVSRDGADVATVTVADARTANDYQGRPAIVLTVTVTASANLAGSYSYNEFDFSARAGDGTTLDQAVLDDGPAELHSGDLAAGQTAKGAIMFVLGSAKASGVTVTYAPGFDTLAFWTVP
jgi:hypothetical protein